ncbi:MAG: DUF721 domain-containing protein [Firmicutes bacterium]|nr:DUF721 domain-containing protein [Bacillota bacterium]
MLPISEILAKTLKKAPYAQKITAQFILDSWPEVVGEYIAQKTKAIAVRQGVLLVRVCDSVWAQHLVLQKKQILDKLNRRQKTNILKDIRFQVGSLETPSVVKAPKKKTETWRRENLTEEELARIEAGFKEAKLPGDLAQSMKKFFITQKKLQKWFLKKGNPTCKKCGLPMVTTTEEIYCLRCKTE